MDNTAIKEQVRARYGAIARRVDTAGSGCGCGSACCATPTPVAEVRAATGCCADGCCGDTATGPAGGATPVAGHGYGPAEIAALPALAVDASLGCGNPTALIELHTGETVLDLGSGGGIDVLLSARRVGPTGRAIGLDMTDGMLALAERNAAEAGVANVTFLKGEIEAIPLPDASVDVIISNCVINLSPDKGATLREAARVLRPGGRFAVSDVIARGAPVPVSFRDDVDSWTGCVGGALHEDEYRALLRAAGFGEPEIVVTGTVEDAGRADGYCGTIDYDGGRFVSAFVRAAKLAR